jgi:hypothetical protein
VNVSLAGREGGGGKAVGKAGGGDIFYLLKWMFYEFYEPLLITKLFIIMVKFKYSFFTR